MIAMELRTPKARAFHTQFSFPFHLAATTVIRSRSRAPWNTDTSARARTPSAPPHTLWCRFVGHFPFLFFVFLMPVVILFVFYFFVRFFSTFFSLSLRFCFVHAIRIMLIASCKSSSCLSGCGPGFFFHYEFAFPPCTNRSLKQKNQNYTTKL